MDFHQVGVRAPIMVYLDFCFDSTETHGNIQENNV